MSFSRDRMRPWVAVVLVGLVAALLPFGPQAVAEPATPEPTATAAVSADVLAQTEDGEETTFWVRMRDEAALNGAARLADESARGRFVVDSLRQTAQDSQAGVLALLESAGAEYHSFWIDNSVQVTGDRSLVDALAGMAEVERIAPDRTYSLPDPPEQAGQQAGPQANALGVEWNVADVRAPEVWSQFGTRGEGIVVGSIDTGVDFDHPALVDQYRGTTEDGFDHNYNWFDPSRVCGDPSLEPCDNQGHGTHTTGTVLGDDGTNGVGVAPGATWIAAKGCEDRFCSSFALTASAQWMLAPTDLSGNNPRPDLRPDVINNSWGGPPGGGDDWYREIVRAWVAAGIFPVFSAGNWGPACDTATDPGDYPESYAVGAYDSRHFIAPFSSRGEGGFAQTKPDIAAPGVGIRSSVPGGEYAFNGGTSMAAPHVTGAVALLWSLAPDLRGQIDRTRELLDVSAVDVDDTSCGGTPEDNNVWGEGRLDVFAAAEQAPRGPAGVLTGTVSGPDGPVAGATVTLTGTEGRSVRTDAEGGYRMRVLAGEYEVSAAAYGYLPSDPQSVTVADGQETTADVTLTTAPRHTVTGVVTAEDGAPVPFASVTVDDTPLAATADAEGRYTIADMPTGEYDLTARGRGCLDPRSRTLDVTDDLTVDVTLAPHVDRYGYVCDEGTVSWVEGTKKLDMWILDDEAAVELPFGFTFYGDTYDSATIGGAGGLSFVHDNIPGFEYPIPDDSRPDGAIFAGRAGYAVDDEAGVYTATVGTAPNRRFVIEWRNLKRMFPAEGDRVTFEVILHENGTIVFQYQHPGGGPADWGRWTSVGIENADATIGFQYARNRPALHDDLSVTFTTPNQAMVTGTVTDANDERPLTGATVTAVQDGTEVRSTTSHEDGRYWLQAPLGEYEIRITAARYEPVTQEVTLDEAGAHTGWDVALETPRVDLESTSVRFLAPEGDGRVQELTLANPGSPALDWDVRETGGYRKLPLPETAPTVVADQPGGPRAAPTYRTEGAVPQERGDVLRTIETVGLRDPNGFGYAERRLWVSDSYPRLGRNAEYLPDGTPTGQMVDTRSWSGTYGADMAYDSRHGLMCQVAVPTPNDRTNGIYCWNLDTGEVEAKILGTFPWTERTQRGLAYRPENDTFYVGGWNQGIIYRINGLSYPDAGAVVNQCRPEFPNTAGLAWNPATGVLWQSTNSPTSTIQMINPDSCETLVSMPHPFHDPWFQGGGLTIDPEGNLWTSAIHTAYEPTAYQIDSGEAAYRDVPWLTVTPGTDSVGGGDSQELRFEVDTTGLKPGTYQATVFLRSDAGRTPTTTISVEMVVATYQQAVNAGGRDYEDRAGGDWSADQRYRDGGWGYVGHARDRDTWLPIFGTDDDRLYRSQRVAGRGGRDCCTLDYRFDGLPDGTYQVELGFAEFDWRGVWRTFDVRANGRTLLDRHHILSDVGWLRADRHTFTVEVTGGTLRLEFDGDSRWAPPVVNSIRVTGLPPGGRVR